MQKNQRSAKQRWVQAGFSAVCVGATLAGRTLCAQATPDLPTAPSAVALQASLSSKALNVPLRDPAGQPIETASDGLMPLSLDEAIARGVKHNLQVKLGLLQEESIRGGTSTVLQNLLPTATATASSSAEEINLTAEGFKPRLVSQFFGANGNFPTIVKVNTVSTQLTLSQFFFDGPDIEFYFSARKAALAASFQTTATRQEVALSVGSEYLAAISDEAQIGYARALLRADEVALRQAQDSHDAGVGTNLDVLRAKVSFQQQQQTVISAENAFAKAKVQLTRLIGLPAGQDLALTDTVPFVDLDLMPLTDARQIAYTQRADLKGMEAEMEAERYVRKAVHYQRLPTLKFNGFYGLLGVVSQGPYHGVFNAQGSITFPILNEGQFRGDKELVEAQITGLRQQIDSLRATIDVQLRSSMLDLEADRALVRVAQSNLALAGQELSDATDRFKAGIDDNLPVVRAEATLANAQTQLVSSTFQYNQAKLQLARNLGVVAQQYGKYLGR